MKTENPRPHAERRTTMELESVTGFDRILERNEACLRRENHDRPVLHLWSPRAGTAAQPPAGPEQIRERIRQAGERAPQEGVRIALELTDQMRQFARGIYLMPAFQRYDLAADIVEGAKANR